MDRALRPPVARHRQSVPYPQPADHYDDQARQRELDDHGAFRGLTATLECGRAGRQFEEALTCVPDPLHFAVVFRLDDTTAIRYAAIARQLLQTPADSVTHRSARTQRPERP